jgi:uncharacterized membrane protein
MAKNIDRNLIYINILFLSFISLVPFSSHLLGSYPQSSWPYFFHSLNLLIIGIITFIIRSHIVNSNKIENITMSKIDVYYGYIRIGRAVVLPILAMSFSFWNTWVSVALLVTQVVVNIIPGFVGLIVRLIGLGKNFN